MKEIEKYVGECFTIDYIRNEKKYRVFTIPTQHFYVDFLSELTPERFEKEIERQKKYEEDSSEMIRLWLEENINENE